MKRYQNISLIFLFIFSMSQIIFASSLRDPTRPAPENYASLLGGNGFKVQAIYHHADNYVAVIDGKTVKAGDEIYGAKVISITSCEVNLKNEDKEFSVSLCYDVKKDSPQ